jgi:hypothetical protein
MNCLHLAEGSNLVVDCSTYANAYEAYKGMHTQFASLLKKILTYVLGLHRSIAAAGEDASLCEEVWL